MPDTPSLTNADETRLISLIESAEERIVFMAPGASEAVASAIAERWPVLGADAVQVVLDVDPEICRLRYGALEGLKRLTRKAAEMGAVVCQQPGVRIGLLIADDTTLFYSPTPLLVEAGSSRENHPNAILLGTVPDEVGRDIGLGPNGIQDRIVGLDGVEARTTREVEENLKANPPQKFDLARQVRVYTSKFQFVELEMTGVHISRRRVNIPSHLIGLARDQDVGSQFHANFNLVNTEDLTVKTKDGNELNEKNLTKEKKQIIDRFLISLKGYGNVVLRANKEKLVEAVNELEEKVGQFKERVEQELQAAIDDNIEKLINALFPAVKQNPPDEYTKYYGDHIPDKNLRGSLEKDLKKAFGRANALVGNMKVSLVFKDVTYESLKDSDFLEVARDALPGIDELHEEYDAARTSEPEGRTNSLS